MRWGALLGVVVLSSCGAAPPPAPPAPARPTGPSPTFTYAPHALLVRVDSASIRETPIATEVADVLRATPFFGGASHVRVDPVSDLDVIVASTETMPGSDGPLRWRIVMRHHADAASARSLFGPVPADAAVWSEREGYAVIAAPSTLPSVHVVVLTAAHEAVIAPDDELSRIASVARAQASYRRAEGDAVEPALRAIERELVFVEAAELPARLTDLGVTMMRASAARSSDGDRVDLRLEADFRDAAAASAAVEETASALEMLGHHPFAAMLGVGHILSMAHASASGAKLTIASEATFDELRRLTTTVGAVLAARARPRSAAPDQTQGQAPRQP